MSELIYFAYGSNMLTSRLRQRVPSAVPVQKARLLKHKLAWHKQGVDNSGKCDIVITESENSTVHGVLFRMKSRDKIHLDRTEQIGTGYDTKQIEVKVAGSTVPAFTYYALMKDASLKPYRWYKKLVIQGAKEHQLPQEYIERLEEIETWSDSNRERVQKANSILQENINSPEQKR